MEALILLITLAQGGTLPGVDSEIAFPVITVKQTSTNQRHFSGLDESTPRRSWIDAGVYFSSK